LREQLGIGVYGAEGTQIPDEIIREYRSQAETSEPGDGQINTLTDAGVRDEKNNTIVPKYQHYNIPSFKEQRRQYYKLSEPYVSKIGFVYPEEWKDNDLYRRAKKAAMLYTTGRTELWWNSNTKGYDFIALPLIMKKSIDCWPYHFFIYQC